MMLKQRPILMLVAVSCVFVLSSAYIQLVIRFGHHFAPATERDSIVLGVATVVLSGLTVALCRRLSVHWVIGILATAAVGGLTAAVGDALLGAIAGGVLGVVGTWGSAKFLVRTGISVGVVAIGYVGAGIIHLAEWDYALGSTWVFGIAIALVTIQTALILSLASVPTTFLRRSLLASLGLILVAPASWFFGWKSDIDGRLEEIRVSGGSVEMPALPKLELGIVRFEIPRRLHAGRVSLVNPTGRQLGTLRMFDDVQSIWVSGRSVTDETLAAVPLLPNIRRVNVSGTKVTSAGLEYLRGFPSTPALTGNVPLDSRTGRLFSRSANADASKPAVFFVGEFTIMRPSLTTEEQLRKIPQDAEVSLRFPRLEEVDASLIAALDRLPNVEVIANRSEGLPSRPFATATITHLPSAIQELQHLTHRGSKWAFSYTAFDAVRRLGDRSTPQLLAALDSPNTEIQSGAALALASLGMGSRAIPQLVAILDNGEVAGFSGAAAALQNHGSVVVPALARALEDPNPQIQWEAARALRNVRQTNGSEGMHGQTPLAVAALTRSLETADPQIQREMAFALSTFGEAAADAAPALAARLSDPYVGGAAASALAAMPRVGLKPLLDAASSLNPDRRAAASSALYAMGSRAKFTGAAELVLEAFQFDSGDDLSSVVKLLSGFAESDPSNAEQILSILVAAARHAQTHPATRTAVSTALVSLARGDDETRERVVAEMTTTYRAATGVIQAEAASVLAEIDWNVAEQLGIEE